MRTYACLRVVVSGANRVSKGVEGDIKLTGSTTELDDFTIRIVDGLFFAPPSFVCHNSLCIGPHNVAATDGPHAHIFKERIGKTHFFGQPVPAGNIWQAKGTFDLTHWTIHTP